MSRTKTIRCDGCATVSSGVVRHEVDEGSVVYCPGCETLRQLRGIKPAAHEQYKLEERSDPQTET